MQIHRSRQSSRCTWPGLGLASLTSLTSLFCGAVGLAQPDLGHPAPSRAPATARPAPAAATEAAETDADFKEAVTGKNVTATYNAKYQQDVQTLFPPQRRAFLQGYRILVVPGFVTGFYMHISQIAKDSFAKDDFLDYLKEPSEAVKELGLNDAQELLDKKQFNTQASVAVNAQRIVRAVKDAAAAGKKVILISHSKGGNDTLAALLLLQKKGGLQNVRGWLSVQSGFFGSPVADEAMQSPTVQAAAKLFLEEAGGTLDSLSDATSPACEKFMTANAPAIRKLVKTLPIISFVSWKAKPRSAQLLHPDTILATSRNFMEGKGLKNDGLIPRKNGVLPGTEYVAKAGIDHAEPAMRSPSPVLPGTLDRKKFTWALLAMLLDRIQPKPRHK